MGGHLLALSIGPVQEFIAAARRTRDLWFGSFLLSELSKAAAKAIADESGHDALVFPAPKTPEELEPTPEGEEPRLTVANVVVAALPDGAKPEDLAGAAHEAVQARWREFAEEARKAASELVRDDVWHSQLDDVIEVYAAWVPLGDGEAAYKTARKRLMRLLDGRKRCRDFPQPKGDPEDRRLPKSSLDGRRETVLKAPKDTGPDARRKARLRDGEQLDVVGLTKRLAHGKRAYVSVARVAADPWLRGVALRAGDNSDVAGALKKLAEECRKLGAKVISRVDTDKFHHYAGFPYDGTAVYRNRYEDLAHEGGIERRDLAELERALDRLAKPSRQGGLGFGDPHPYLAVLVADGDRMGKLIAALGSPEDHRSFSRKLAEFAKAAEKIVKQHNGVCIYAGGDDVLALVPVDKCLDCARALHDRFASLVGPAAPPDLAATFSVGLAVGHFMEPLEDLRNYARAAEKAAKNATPDTDAMQIHAERNGLAVFVHPRGGVPFGVREQFGEEEDSIEKRLRAWAELFGRGALPNKLPYEVRQTARQYEGWENEASVRQALQPDLLRLLKRKDVRLKDREKTWVEARLRGIGSAAGLHRLAAEMLVAQHISQAVRQANPRAAGAAPATEGSA